MISLVASLFGIGKWLREAATALFGIIVRHPWQAGLIASLVACAVLWWHSGRVADQRDRALATIEEMTRLSKAADKAARATEKKLAENAKAITKEKNDAIARISADRDAVLEQLRSRPSRPSTTAPAVASNGKAASGCTGAELYRPDSEFLVWEAARADNIRVSLKACYAQYDDAREKMQALQAGDNVSP